MIEPIDEHVDASRQRNLAELKEFLAIPSISAEPARKGDVRRAAEWVAARLDAAGMRKVTINPTPGHPVVTAEWLEAPGRPTVLVYGHYDVQPADPLEQWSSPPFEPVLRDGRIYARGVSDDKAPVFTVIKTIQALLAERGGLPVNVKVLFEGEEETGSPNLEPFIAANRELLAADLIISADGGMASAAQPSVNVSGRGICAMEVTVSGPGRDLHSGRHGGAVQNPLHALAALIAGLHDERGRVTVNGFYAGVRELSEQERAELARFPRDAAAYARELGVDALWGEAGYTALERETVRPTLEVNGMWGGYQGPGPKTVIPAAARAKITCRLVHEQDPDQVTVAIERHLHAHLPPGVRLAFTPIAGKARAYEVPGDFPALAVAEEVLREFFSQPPLRVRMGGSVPVTEVFARVLGAHTVFFSFSVADENIHSPNEFFREERLWLGQRAWARYWDRLAAGIT
jgi:acetylornithine deacetylase/succinyl-diaminopimelate desuccinylase-like protein